MTPTIWTGCYSPGWDNEDMVEEAWSHPAKFAKGLIFRLLQHLVRQGYVSTRDLICDPFGGVALGALPSMAYGLRYLGCELEAKFQVIGTENIALWRQRYGFTGATILQGDSRNLRHVLEEAQVSAVVSSPPFSPAGNQPSGHRQYVRKEYREGGHAKENAPETTYGSTPGQLGAMKPGTLADAIVSSPPYGDQGVPDARGLHFDDQHAADGRTRRERSIAMKQAHGVKDSYADVSPGQLGAMKLGTIDAVVSSPPWGDTLESKDMVFNAKARPGRTIQYADYGDSPGQIGAEPSTFWEAASAIVGECYAILRPSGVAAWVVKNYVSKGEIVPFCDQWRQLCEAQGFVLLEEIHASLVEHHGIQTGLFGEDTVEETARMSFFRRLHTKKYPHLAITHETILIFRKESTS